MRTKIKYFVVVSLLFSLALLAVGSKYYAEFLYFPHVATSSPWRTEIALINTGDQTVGGTLSAFSDEGELVETKDVALFAHGRKQIDVASEFTSHADIAYMIFHANSDAVRGYMKFYREGVYRAAIPAVKEVNNSDVYIPHIASDAKWWTGISLVNTTSATKELTIAFNNGQSRNIILNANEHRAFDIASLFDNQPRPDIQSAVITNANGIIGLELFGNSNQLGGLLLTDKTASMLFYPHVADGNWLTGIVAYNPSNSGCNMAITPYAVNATGSLIPVAAKGKYVGAISAHDIPGGFSLYSTMPLSSFEIFTTVDNQQLAVYAGADGNGAREGVFPKIEKNGWTGIAFVNLEWGSTASVALTAYDDNGSAVATQTFTVGATAKVVNVAEALFSQDISSATYISYSSDMPILGFQLNGSADGTMLDGLPALIDSDPTSVFIPYIDESLKSVDVPIISTIK